MKHKAFVAQKRPYNQKKRGATMFPGIIDDAKALGCHRTTLYKVLTGKWRLPGLMNRYLKLVEQKEKAPKPKRFIDDVLAEKRNEEVAK
jgi:hypothetical protein